MLKILLHPAPAHREIAERPVRPLRRVMSGQAGGMPAPRPAERDTAGDPAES